MFPSLKSEVDINDSKTLYYESHSGCNDESNIQSELWTLKLKPPAHNDALNFIEKLKNIRFCKQFQFKHNNVIENIRSNLLSLTLPIINDLNFFASESNVILEPLKQPPSYVMAFKWLELRNFKLKHKKKTILCNKRKGNMTPESVSKTLLLKKTHHSTPNSSLSKFFTTTPYTPMKSQNKCLISRRKLSALFLNSLHVRQCKFKLIHLYYVY